MDSSRAERISSAWDLRQYVDDFDGPVRISSVRERDATFYVVERDGITNIHIKPRSLCLLANNPKEVDLIIDKHRFDKVHLSVSDDGETIVFKHNIHTWIEMLDKGRSLKIRFKDCLRRIETFAFDISGSTHMRRPKKIQ